MTLALRALGSALVQVYTHFASSVIANLVAIVLSIPVLVVVLAFSYGIRSFGLVPLGVALFIGVLPNPATCGVQYIAHELANGEILSASDQWSGLQRYWAVALRTWLASVPITILIFLNLVFYGRLAAGTSSFRMIAGPVELLWLAVFLFWIALHLYVFPLLLAQEARRLLTTYRNATVLALGRPVFTLTLVPLWLAILFLCAATGLATIIGLAVGAAIQQNALARLLPTFPQQS